MIPFLRRISISVSLHPPLSSFLPPSCCVCSFPPHTIHPGHCPRRSPGKLFCAGCILFLLPLSSPAPPLPFPLLPPSAVSNAATATAAGDTTTMVGPLHLHGCPNHTAEPGLPGLPPCLMPPLPCVHCTTAATQQHHLTAPSRINLTAPSCADLAKLRHHLVLISQHHFAPISQHHLVLVSISQPKMWHVMTTPVNGAF